MMDFDKISAGDEEAANKRIEIVKDIPVLELNHEIQKLAQRYFDSLDIPEKARLDASHLAIAVWHEIDYLLSWNCKHIVSGRVKKVLEKINTHPIKYKNSCALHTRRINGGLRNVERPNC